ncbi:MAG: ABC transporter permease subunit, partial [Chloroflexi bacterium]|nr:ABC transporter permease subunit [Chloroflexota bacterium]
MNDQSIARNRPENRSGMQLPVWWLVFRQEFTDLWIGGRVFLLLVLFSGVMSVTAILREVESQLSLIPPAEMIFLTLLGGISFGLFIGLIIGADSISGERERATLEALLLTPTARRQIVIGKFLAALSPWPATLLLSIPYILIVAQGDEILGPALLLGALLGGVLAVAFTGFGMLVSIWSNSNKMSLFVSLLVYMILLIPTQFPGSAQKGDLGYAIQQLNPMQASSEFLEKVLVNNRTVAEKSSYLVAAIVSAVGVLGLLFFYAAPRLSLEGDAPRLPALKWRRAANLLAITGLGAALALPTVSARAAPFAQAEQALEITLDLAYTTVNAGDEIEFNTVVTNSGTEASPALNVAMNIVKTGKGDPVDPEDWSPERTQQVDALAPGESAEQTWTID